MKYSKKVTLAPLVALVLFGSLTAYFTMHSSHQDGLKPAKPPVESSSNVLNPTKTAPTQSFAGIDGMKINYPPRWEATASPNNSNAEQQSVVFKAPNTTTRAHGYGDEMIMTGAKITLYKNNFSKSKNLDDFKKSDSYGWKHAENKKESVIKDIPVAEFDVSSVAPAQHYAVFYKDSHEYVMAIDSKAYKNDEYKEAFTSMIKNMEFTKSP